MTITTEIIETKLEDDEELYIGEEDEDRQTVNTTNVATKDSAIDGSLVADGKYVVPKGVAVEELKNFSGEYVIVCI